MKRNLLAIGICLTLTALAACTTYEPGEMQGGSEAGTVAGPGDSIHSLSADKADGMGNPVANGVENVEPREIYARGDSSITSKPY